LAPRSTRLVEYRLDCASSLASSMADELDGLPRKRIELFSHEKKKKKRGVQGLNRVPYVAGVPLSKSVPGNHCAKFSIPHTHDRFSAPLNTPGAKIKSQPSNR
jgi:hypothetical protein